MNILTNASVVPLTAKKVTFDDIWARLEGSGIFSESAQGDASLVSKEATYRDVSRICKMGKAPLLAEKVDEKIQSLV